MAAPKENGQAGGGNKSAPAATDAVDLTVFLGGLQREIHDLHASIKASRDGRVEKAFQRLPRNMRRRTASHNAKRLPRRLRQQARRDQAADNTPSVAAGLAKRKKGRTASTWVYESTKKRVRLQEEKKLAAAGRTEEVDDDNDDGIDDDEDNDPEGGAPVGAVARPGRLLPLKKLRLPTHLWHAKRARMANPGALWNALIVQTPANKTYRMALRASGLRPGMCVCRDTSYMAVISLSGPSAQLDATLASVVEPHLLTPALRCGACCVDVKLPRSFGYQQQQKQRGDAGGELGGPGNCGALTLFYNPTSEPIADDTPRAAFLRVHPTVLSHVWTTLQRDVAQAKRPVMVRDCRLEVGSIDVTGSAAAEALAATFYPYQTKDAPIPPQGHDFLRLRSLDTTALAAASGTLLAFDIQDPRLDEPDKRAEDTNTGNNNVSSGNALAAWPSSARDSAARHASGLFDVDRRHKATRQLPQATLARRRGALDAGAKLLLSPTENHAIPIMVGVVGPSVPATADPNRRGGGGGGRSVAAHVPPTWTVLAPRLCIDILWRRLLLHRLARNGGQRPQCAGLEEDRHMALERGDPWFPADFPGTPAGWDWELQERVRLETEWQAKPSAKRPQWSALDLGNGAKRGELGSGFACDWELLFGMDTVPTTEAERTAATSDAEDEQVQFAAMRPGAQPDLVRQMQHATWAEVRAAVQAARRQQPPVWRSPFQLMTVSVQMLQGGVPHPQARLYRLPAAATLRARWLALAKSSSSSGGGGHGSKTGLKRMPPDADLNKRKQLLAQSLLETPAPYPRPEPDAAHPPVPDTNDLFGFVTSGAHRFQNGKGFGIGHVSTAKLVEAILAAGAGEDGDAAGAENDNDEGQGRVHIHRDARLCIVRNAGERVGRLARWTPISH